MLLFSWFVGFSIVQAQSPKLKKVLFIGNSYTAVNDLPNWVRAVAESGGDTFEVVTIAPGGTTFSMHNNNPQVTMELGSGNYDAVILQEQSQLPSFPLSQVESDCFPYAKALVDAARAGKSCIKVVFYMTWGRENGDAMNCPTWPPVCTFQGMNELLRQRYIQMAKDNSCDVAPVGAVWREVRKSNASLGLYQGDGSHPSVAGTHLAALTIYRALTGKTLDTGLFKGPIDATDHKTIIEKVNFISKDSSSLWQYDTCYRKTAGLSDLMSLTHKPITHRWMEDGKSLEIFCGGETEAMKHSHASNSAMPVSGDNQLLNSTLMVMDAMGRMVWTSSKSESKWVIDTEKWPCGLYFVKTSCGDGVVVKH